MTWNDIMRRVLPPIGSALPDTTSPYGAVAGRPAGSTKPHRGVDFNYLGAGRLNRSTPALRAPVTGIVTKAGEGKWGTVAIRDANGFSHEILHTRAQHVRAGDPVVAGQLIGTMGNTGLKVEDPVNDPNKGAHAHYQLRDAAGNVIDPSAYWNQQGPIDPNPTPPAFLNEHQRYLRRVDQIAGNTVAAPMGADTSMPFGTGEQFAPGSATSSRPLYDTRSFVPPSQEATPTDIRKNFPRLVRIYPRQQDLAGFDPNAPAAVSNEIPPAGRPATFDDRFGNWSSLSGVSAPLAPNQPVAPPPQLAVRSVSCPASRCRTIRFRCRSLDSRGSHPHPVTKIGPGTCFDAPNGTNGDSALFLFQ